MFPCLGMPHTAFTASSTALSRICCTSSKLGLKVMLPLSAAGTSSSRKVAGEDHLRRSCTQRGRSEHLMPLREGAHLQPRLLNRAAGVSAQAELLSYSEHLGMCKLPKQSAKSQLMRILATGCRALARSPTGSANLTLQQTLTVHNCPGLQVAARYCGPAPDGRNICTWWGSHGRSSAFCCRHCTRASRESCASWRNCLPCNTSSINLEEAVELQSAQATRGLAVDAHPAAAVEIDSAVHAAIAAARPALGQQCRGACWQQHLQGLVLGSCDSSRACTQQPS